MKKHNKLFGVVKLHMDRKGVIQIINTILRNVGDERKISPKDSFKRISKCIEYLNQKHRFNVSCLIDLDKCKRKKKFIRNTMRDYLDCSTIRNLITVGRNEYYLEIIVEYNGDIDVWKELVSQYPKSLWLVDLFSYNDRYKDDFCKGLRFIECLILENKIGEVSCHEYYDDELEEPMNFYPVHYGYINLLGLDWDCIISQKGQHNSLRRHKFNNMFVQWNGFRKEIYNELLDSYYVIDKFFPFYCPTT